MSRATKIWITLGLLVVGVAATVTYVGPVEVLKHLVLLSSEDTEYAPGFSESAFRAVEIGDSEAEVRAAVGEPLETVELTPSLSWLYTPTPQPEFAENGHARGTYTHFRFEEGRCVRIFGQVSQTPGGGMTIAAVGPGQNSLSISAQEEADLVKMGATPAEIEAQYGPPTEVHDDRAVRWLVYSHSPGSTHYRKRRIAIDANGQVCRKDSEIYWD